MVRCTLHPRRRLRIGSGRSAGCCCWLSRLDGRWSRTSPSLRRMAVSRLALGRKQRKMVAGSLAGTMGMKGTVRFGVSFGDITEHFGGNS